MRLFYYLFFFPLIPESIKTGCTACLLQAFSPMTIIHSSVKNLTSGFLKIQSHELRDINAVHTDYNLSRNSYTTFSLQWIKRASSGCFCQKEIIVCPSWTWPAKKHDIRQKTLDHFTLLYRFTILNCRRQQKKTEFWWRSIQW